MSTSRDPDRLIHSFLLEGEDELFDQVYDRVRAGIEVKPQRVLIGPWRMPIMNKIVGYGLAAAAVVIVVIVGAQLVGSGGNGFGDAPTPSPEASVAEPTVSPEPNPLESAAPTLGPLGEGPFIIVYEMLFGVRTTVTIPAPDWHGLQYSTFVEKDGMAGPPQGAGLIVLGGDMVVYGDPCAWESTRPDTPPASLDELVAALSAQASRDATPPVDVTVGGYPGKMLTLHVPDDAVFTDCDRGEFRTLSEVQTDDGGDLILQGPGQIDEVWVVDVDGTLIVFNAGYFADTPAESVDEMRAIVESATFETP